MATTINAGDLLLTAGRTTIVSQPTNVTVTSTSINAVSVTASDQVFKFLAGSGTPTNLTTTLTATLTGTLTAYLWQYYTGGSPAWTSFSTNNSSQTFTLSHSDAAWAAVGGTTLRVRCRSGSDLYTDEISIAKLYDGASPRSVDLTVGTQAFTYDANGATPSPVNTTVTATARNTTGTVYYEFFVNGTSVQASSTTSTYTYTPQTSYGSMPQTIRVDVRDGAVNGAVVATDSLSIFGVKPGAQGNTGAAGANAITVAMPNDSHVLPTTTAGVVTYTGSGTTIQVYEGSTLLTYASTLANGSYTITTPVTVSSGTVTPGAITGTGTTTATVGEHSNLTTDSATITYTINIRRIGGGDVTINQVQSLAKSNQGATGGAGTNARSVDLTAATQVISYDANGATPSAGSIVLTATARNTSGTVYYEFTGTGISQNTTTNTYTYTTPTTYSSTPLTVTVNIREGASTGTVLATDVLTIYSVKPGAQGNTGAAGANAITVAMPNDSHVLPTTTAGVVTYTGSGTTIQVYEGSTLLTYASTLANGSYTITTPVTVSSGTVTPGAITGTGTTTATVGEHSNLTTDSATITYTINIRRIGGGDVTINQVQSLAKSNQGATGGAGTNARSVDLTAATQVISYDANGATPSAGSIVLTATARNTSGTVYYEFTGTGISQNTTTNTYTYTTPTTYSSTPLTVTVNIREGASTGTVLATDVLTIYSVKPGAQGNTGAAGANAITVAMPNDSHVLPTTTAGVVTYTGSGTTIQVYEGSTLLTYASTLANGSYTITTPVTVSSGTVTPGAITGTGTTTATVGEHSNLTTDSATITYTINIRRIGGGDVTINQVQSLAKSNQGATGGAGTNARSVDLTAATQVISYDANGATPSAGSIVLTATARNTSGTVYYEFTGTGISQNTTTNTYTYTTPTTYSSTPLTVTVNIREGASTGTVLATDVLTIYSVKPGAQGNTGTAGLSALTPILINGSHTVPADSSGIVLAGGYAGSGTNIRVLEGTTDLLFTSSTTPSAGEFTITDPPTVSPSGAITPGSFSVSVSDPLQNSSAGLAGKFFNGAGNLSEGGQSNSYWRDVAFSGSYTTNNIGNVGTLPLDSSDTITPIALPSGVQLLSNITYTGSPGTNYGFIAIGYFRPPTTGNYYFRLTSDDYSAVWIGDLAVGTNNRSLANATVVANVNTGTSGAISLSSNNYYAIRIAMEEGQGGDYVTFEWSSNGTNWSNDLTQNFKAPPSINGTYNYVTLSGTDQYYNSVSSLLHFETYGATFTDSSYLSRTVTRGDADNSYGGSAFNANVPATSPIGSSYALALNGTTDYISFTGPDPLYSGGPTTPWTVECWVYTSAGGPIFTRQYGLYNASDLPSGYHIPVWIGLGDGYYQGTTGLYPTIAWYKDSVWYYGAVSETAITANTWTHLAFVFTGSAFKVFKDGVDVSANGYSNVTLQTTSYDFISAPNYIWYIGRDWNNTKYNGYIDEFRITKGVARYTANFTRPSAPFLSDTTYKPTIALGQGAGGVDVSNHSAMSGSVDVATITYPITAKRANGTSTALSLVQTVTKSKGGTSGTNARSVDLTAATQVISYDANGATPSAGSIVLTATARNTSGTVYYEFTGTGISQNTTTNTYTYTTPTTYSSTPLTVTVNIREGASTGTVLATDVLTIYSVKPGAQGGTGAAGANAITVAMPNDSHVLPTTTAGVVTYTGSGTTIQVYEGSTLLTYASTLANGSYTITTPVTVSSGTVTPGTITGTGTTTATVGEHSNLTTDSATITYTINIRRIGGGDVTINQVQSLAKSNQGAIGPTGANAQTLRLTSSSQTFKYDFLGVPSPAVQTINFTVNLQNVSGTATYGVVGYDSAGTAYTIVSSGTSTSNNTFSLTNTQFLTNINIVRALVTVTLGSLTDTTSIIKVQDGAAGYTMSLSSSSLSLNAASNGTVIIDGSNNTHANAQAKVYYNGVDDTNNWGFYVTALGSGIGYKDADDSGARTGTGVYSGYLGGTNLLPNSNTIFAQSGVGASGSQGVTWVAPGVAGAIDAPDGTVLGAGVLSDDTDATSRQHQGLVKSDYDHNTGYTISGYIKKAGTSDILIASCSSAVGSGRGQWTYNFATGVGTTTSSASNTTVSFTQLPNGWVRFVANFITSTNTGLTVSQQNYFFWPETTSAYVGNGTRKFAMWGIQLEKGSVGVLPTGPTGLTQTLGAAASGTPRGYVSVSSLTQDSTYLDVVAYRPGFGSLIQRLTVTRTRAGQPGEQGPTGPTGSAGLSAITALMPNGSHTLPSNSSGTVTSYAGSGTNIRVFEGTTELTYVASTLSNSTFTLGTAIVDPSGTITVGGYSAAGSDPLAGGSAGLAGKFFNGSLAPNGSSWTPYQTSGSIGFLPLTSTNQGPTGSGVTLYGVNGINYSGLGDYYGFIAIGYFKPPTTGNYYFRTNADDGSGVWLGNDAVSVISTSGTRPNPIVSNFNQWGQTVPSQAQNLSSNNWYAIRIIHEEGSGGDNLNFQWSSDGNTWSNDLSQYFKVPAPVSGSYDYTSTTNGILTPGAGAGGMDVGPHSNMNAATSVLTINYPITVQRANSTQSTIYLTQTLTKAVSGTSGTSYYMSPSAAAVRQSAAGAYTPSTISFPAYSSVTGSNPTLLSAYYKLYLNGSGTASYTSSSAQQNYTYTPSGTVTSIRVESFLDSGFATKVADITVPITADGSRGSLTGYGNKYGFSSGSWVNEVANRVINNMLTGSTDTSNMYSTDHLRVGDTVTLSSEQDQNANLPGVQGFAQTKFWTGTEWVLLGSVVDGNLLVNGTLAAEKITAGTITADRLVVTGKGGATILSDDPYFQDPSYWSRTSNNIGFTSGSGASGSVSTYYVQCGSGTDQYIESIRYYQISSAKTYNLSCNLYTQSGNNRNMYIYVEFFTSTGAYIGNATTGWGGSKSGYVYGAIPTADVFTRQGGRFGTGVSNRAIPSNATQCRIGVWFQYSDSGSSQVVQAAQDLRLDEVLDGSTYIQNINASTITTGTLNANLIGANSISVDQLAAGKISIPISGQPTVQLGKNLRDSGHHGLTLSAGDWDNIFMRRDDGITFFRVNDPDSTGGNGISFNSYGYFRIKTSNFQINNDGSGTFNKAISSPSYAEYEGNISLFYTNEFTIYTPSSNPGGGDVGTTGG